MQVGSTQSRERVKGRSPLRSPEAEPLGLSLLLQYQPLCEVVPDHHQQGRNCLVQMVDFQLDTGIEDEKEGLLYVRSRIVLASAAAKLEPPVDGVTVAIDDTQSLARDVSSARKLGFGAKLCIHPRQVSAVNEGFGPSDEDLLWARSVVDAAARSDGFGAIRLNGKLIDRPVVERAKRMLEGAR